MDAALQLTRYFHCTSRCVRGGFLCGIDRNSGKNYTHRRVWLRNRLLQIAEIFSIKIAAFAIMENHFHVVLRVDSNAAEAWSDIEVIHRWHQLFKGTHLSQRQVELQDLSNQELSTLADSIHRWRKALQDIGWFMRCTKEPLARQSNREDGCTGRFWEGRFHSQALLDTKAVIACMTYVDLNPVRARMCMIPEADKYTSLYYRVKALPVHPHAPDSLPTGLIDMDQIDGPIKSQSSLPVCTLEYIELLDAAARRSRPDKIGTLSELVKPALERLGIKLSSWQDLEIHFSKHFHVLVGNGNSLKTACQILGQKCAWGQRSCQEFFGDSPGWHDSA
jgi:REP element-mobilizing transposase RayT